MLVKKCIILEWEWYAGSIAAAELSRGTALRRGTAQLVRHVRALGHSVTVHVQRYAVAATTVPFSRPTAQLCKRHQSQVLTNIVVLFQNKILRIYLSTIRDFLNN